MGKRHTRISRAWQRPGCRGDGDGRGWTLLVGLLVFAWLAATPGAPTSAASAHSGCLQRLRHPEHDPSVRERPGITLGCAKGAVLRVPKIFNLRTDPYERADITSNTYYDWIFDHVFLLVPAHDYVGQLLATLKDYPQRQKAASFNVDEVLAKLKEVGSR